jgi:hypothetical protein
MARKVHEAAAGVEGGVVVAPCDDLALAARPCNHQQ